MDNFLITITDMNCISLNKVEYIIGFDSTAVALATENGKVMIEGSEMKIESLEKGEGKIVVTGKIKGVFAEVKKDEKGILKKLFR